MDKDNEKQEDGERLIGKRTTEKEGKDLNRILTLVNEGAGGISSIKRVTQGILAIINDPKSSARDLRKLVEIDPPLCLKVLKMANSAYYAPTQRVSSIDQAIVNIGFTNVQELALSLKVCEIFTKKERILEYSRSLLWQHSIFVALLGKMIYRREFGEKGQEVYAAGLLHDIGIIVEDQFLHDDFQLILRRSKLVKENLPPAELHVLGYTHADIGGALAADWNLPSGLMIGIGFHHMPDHAKRSMRRIASTLFIAEYLSAENDIGYSDASFISFIAFEKQVRTLGLTIGGLDLIVRGAKQELLDMERKGALGI